MKKSPLMRKLMVLMMTLAVVFTYSVAPMNQSFAASAKKPAKVKSVKAVALSDSQTSIKVSWKKAKNAKKYQVYMATKKKGKFKKIGTTKKLEYVKASLKDGKKYYFKVRAVNGKKKGAFSKVKSAKAKYVPAPAPAPGVKETPATIGESKTATLTTEIDMSKYPANQVVKVWVPVPQTDTVNGYQYITNEDFVADKATEARFTNKDGNRMLYLEWGKDVAPADRLATLSFTAQRYDVSRTNLKDDPKAALSDEAKAYVNKESTYVNISDPIVKKYAAEAVKNVKDKNSTVEKTRAIYEWVINNLARIDNGETFKGYTFGVEGCGYGDTKKILTEFDKYGISGGHCTDLNSTFVALCRANGIAAREMFGIRLGDPGQDISGFQHCWAEFYLPGTGWVYADPADVLKAIKPKDTGKGIEIDLEKWAEAKASEKCKERTAYFWGHVDNNRVVLSRGRDVTFEPAQSWGACNTFGYPAAEVDGKRNPQDFTDAAGFVYKITSQSDKTVFVDAAYVKAASDRKAANTVIAEVSWGETVEDGVPSRFIPGAIHVNTDMLECNHNDWGYELWDLRGFDDNYKLLMDALAKYGITKDTELICYGWDGCNSAPTRLAFAALMLGVKDVKVLDGGAEAWDAAGYPDAARSEPKSAESFGLDKPAHADWVIDSEALVTGVKNDTLVPVSIRSYDEFIGAESGYPYIDKAGEPWGAVWGRDTDDDTDDNKTNSDYFIDGKTVGVDKVLEYLADYDVTENNMLAFYCGTGWRATIPFLICYQAGMENIRLWDDGWFVYSGAYQDPWNWNYGDNKKEPPTTFTSDDYPVQLGDPKEEEVIKTTVGELDNYRNPLKSISAKAEKVSAVAGTDVPNGFSIAPGKANINKSINYTSDTEAVATIDENGVVSVKADAPVGSKAKITAASKATFGNTRTKAGEPKKASYEIDVVGSYLDLYNDSWKLLGINYDDISEDDFLIDVRNAETFGQGHLEGSLNCPVSNPFTADQKTAIKAAYDKAGGKRVVIVCVSGNMLAKNAMQALKESGADMGKVTYLIGGANGAKDHWIDYLKLSDEEWAKRGVDAVEDGDFIIDVRPDAQRESAGCVPGAEICPVGNPYTPEQKAAIKTVVDEKAGSARVVIVCVTGRMLARNAMAALDSAGADMSRITYLKGGFNNGWSKMYPYTIGKVTVDPIAKTASLDAKVNEAYTDGKAITHLVLDPKGKNGTDAPFLTEARALDLHAALTSLGAKPWSDTAREFGTGKKLSEVEGDNADFTHLDILVVKGNTEKRLADCINYEYKGEGTAVEDPFDMAFSGNKENHTAWNTGCVSCIFSCYAGIVSNNAIGIGTVSATENYFTVNTDVLSANDEVTLVYNLNMD